MKCKTCIKDFLLDEIDSDGLCFTCANDDPYYNPDHTTMIKELLENTMNGLAAARHESPNKIKADLVAEHVYNNPEKYINEVISQATNKKKNDPSGN